MNMTSALVILFSVLFIASSNALAECGQITAIQTTSDSFASKYSFSFKDKDGKLSEFASKAIADFQKITLLRAAGFNTICISDDKATGITKIDGVNY